MDIDNKRKGEFLIDSTALKTAKGRSRRNIKFEVKRLKSGTHITIKNWIIQMDTYFTIKQVYSEAFVGFILIKIVSRQLNKINQYKSLDYLAFREILVEVFIIQDFATAYLHAFARQSKTREMSRFDYMHRKGSSYSKLTPTLRMLF